MSDLRDIEPVADLSWLDQAQIRLIFTVDIAATPSQVFAVLADHEAWPEWFSPVRAVTHVGPAEGVGARRRVEVPPLIVDEVFIAWDEPHRYTFTSAAINLRVVSALAEDWQLAETPNGTRVTNVVAAELPRWLRPFRSGIRLGMRRTTSSGVQELKRRVESLQARP